MRGILNVLSGLSSATSPALLLTLAIGGTLAVAGLIGRSSLALVIMGCFAALLIAWAEAPSVRRTATFLFGLAMIPRLLALALVALWPPDAATFLSPDGLAYYEGSRGLADSRFGLATHPEKVFGTYDVAHYFVFATVTIAFDGGLQALQSLNATLTALTAPLVWAIVLRARPAWANRVGIAVALFPSAIALSTVNLLKDPSLVFAVVLAIWALSRLLRDSRVREVVLLTLVLGVAMIYLRMGRFYLAPFLEISVIIVALRWGISRTGRARLRSVAAPILVAFVLAEAIPFAVGWPTSVQLVVQNVRHVLETPILRDYETGLTERISRSPAPTTPAPTTPAPATAAPATAARGVATQPAAVFVANLVRRVFGPFVWVPPERWDPIYVASSDVLLYPGMMVWYAVMPLVLVGLITTMAGLIRGTGRPIEQLLAVFLILYSLMYLAINLSYRQRDLLFPFAVVFAAICLDQYRDRLKWPYFVYWLLLIAVAVAHTVIRGRVL